MPVFPDRDRVILYMHNKVSDKQAYLYSALTMEPQHTIEIEKRLYIVYLYTDLKDEHE